MTFWLNLHLTCLLETTKRFLKIFPFLPLLKFRKVDFGVFTAQNPLESLKSSDESFRPKSKNQAQSIHSYISVNGACQWSDSSAYQNVQEMRNGTAILAFFGVFWRFLAIFAILTEF